MSTSRTASGRIIRMWLSAGLALAVGAGRASGAELVAVPESDAPESGVAAAPWRVSAVSSEKSQLASGASSLRVDLARGDRASSTRSIGLESASGLVVRFNLSLTGPADGSEVEQVLRVGSGFGDSNSDEPDASTFGRIGVRSTDPHGGFQLRDFAARRTSPSFQGMQAITWVMNRGEAAVSYAAPDGTLEPVATNRMDVWVGRTKVFDDMAVTRAGAGVSDLKWYWAEGSGTTALEQLEILPLEPGLAAAPAPAPGPGPDTEGSLSGTPVANEAPIELYRPSPNPFARTTRFAYAITGGREAVDIGVFDVAGRRVKSLISNLQTAGRYEVAWDGRNDAGDRMRNGIYFLRASIGSDLRVMRIAYLVK